MIREEHGIQCMPCSSRIINEMLPEIHIIQKGNFPKFTVYAMLLSNYEMLPDIHRLEKCDFLKFINHYQIIEFPV